LFCIPIAAYYHDPMLATVLPVLGLKIIIDQIFIVPRALLSRTMSFRKMAMRSITASLIAAAACLAVLYAGFGLWALVMSQLMASFVSCIVSWYAVSWRPSFTFSRAAFREMAGFGMYSSASVIVSTIKTEQLMLGALMGAPVLGLFGFSRRMFQMVAGVMTSSLSAVTYPLLASMQNELPKLREVYLTTTFLSSVLAVPCFVGLALIADEFVPLLFGPQWVDAVTPLRAYCAVGVLYCVGVLQASLIRSRGRADFWLWYQVVQQGTTALVVLATYRFGIEAVAIAMAVKTWLIWPFSARFASRLIGVSALKYLSQFAASLGAALVMAAAVYVVRLALPGGGALSLVLQILAGAAAYSVAIVVLARRRMDQILQLILRERRRKVR
jgi:teichuronic acid exporter